MNSREIPEIKDRIMRYLIADEEIVKLVDPTHEVEYPDDLLYRNLFPFYRVPDTEQEIIQKGSSRYRGLPFCIMICTSSPRS